MDFLASTVSTNYCRLKPDIVLAWLFGPDRLTSPFLVCISEGRATVFSSTVCYAIYEGFWVDAVKARIVCSAQDRGAVSLCQNGFVLGVLLSAFCLGLLTPCFASDIIHLVLSRDYL